MRLRETLRQSRSATERKEGPEKGRTSPRPVVRRLPLVESRPRQRLDHLLEPPPPIQPARRPRRRPRARAVRPAAERTLHEPDAEGRVPGKDVRHVRRVRLVYVVDDEAQGLASDGEGRFRGRAGDGRRADEEVEPLEGEEEREVVGTVSLREEP